MLLKSTTSDLNTLRAKPSHSEVTLWNEMIVFKCIVGLVCYHLWDAKLSGKLGFIEVVFIYFLATFLLILSLALLRSFTALTRCGTGKWQIEVKSEGQRHKKCDGA